MKKVLFALVLVGGLIATSCSKECVCSVKLNGEVITETTVQLEDGQKCSDSSVGGSLLGTSGEIKCTPKLF